MDDPFLYLKEAEPRIGIDGRKGRERVKTAFKRHKGLEKSGLLQCKFSNLHFSRTVKRRGTFSCPTCHM